MNPIGKSLYEVYSNCKSQPRHTCGGFPAEFIDIIKDCKFQITPGGVEYYIKPSDLYKPMLYITTVETGKSFVFESKYLDNSRYQNNTKITSYKATSMSATPDKYLTRKIQVGDYVERISHYDTQMNKGSIWEVTTTDHSTGSVRVTDGRGNWDPDNFKILNPEHPSQSTDIRSYAVSVKNASQTDRQAFYHLLTSLGEPIFKDTTLQKSQYTMNYFLYYQRSKYWTGSNTTDGLVPISVADFIIKFGKPSSSFEDDPFEDSPTYPFKVGDTFFHPAHGTVVVKEIRDVSSYKFPVVYKTKSGNTTDTIEMTTRYYLEYYNNTNVVQIDGDKNKIKPTPVAQPEPTTQPAPKEKTMAQKIKDSAIATVDQNKQALVIASKMEAGRIINKQVLKQLTPHLPFFVQGYTKSPFAPFIAANLVAMVANHTQNKKLSQVSDLMLLGAADSGVAAFNLDKIVDDILSNIKLPAGVLDTDEEL